MRFELVCAAIMGLVFVANAQAPNPRDVKLVGDRFKPLTYDQMTPEQKAMTEHVLGGERGGMGGPFNVMLRSPEMGDLAQKLGAHVRFHSSLSRKQNELAIIITARYWKAEYEWYAHRRLAEQAGVTPAVIEAIRAGKRPASMQPDEEVVYNFVTELLDTKRVSDPIFHAAVEKLGERGVVDMVAVSGYYNLVSMFLNVDRYPLPNGAKPEFAAAR